MTIGGNGEDLRTLTSSHSNRQIDQIAGWTGDGSDWTGGGKVPTSTLPLVRTEKVGFTDPFSLLEFAATLAARRNASRSPRLADGKLAAARAGVSGRNAELLLQGRSLAMRTLRGLAAANQQFASLSARLTDVFVNGHRGILEQIPVTYGCYGLPLPFYDEAEYG